MKRLDNFYRNSKFDFCKNFWKFAIAPIALVVIAIVLLCTVGFNTGFDFTGGTVVTVFSNNDKTFVGEGVGSYDLDSKEGYNDFIKLINESLKENEISTLSYQRTIVTIDDLNIVDGHAIILKIQNADSEKIDAFTSNLSVKLGYDDATNTAKAEESIVVSTMSPTISQGTLNLVIVALIVALAVAFVYLLIRLGLSSAMTVVFGIAHDVLILLCFALVFRVRVETAYLASVVVIMMFSLINNILLMNNLKNNATNGKFEENGKYSKSKNFDVANYTIKETLSRNTILAMISLITLCLCAIIATSAVRLAFISLILGVIASIYANIFVNPYLWAISYIPNKKKVKVQRPKDEYVV